MSRRGLTLRKNGATAICAPAAGSDPGPDFCHLNHLASASASATRPHPSRPRQSEEPCPLVMPFPLVSNMFGGFCPRGDLEHGAELSHLNPVQLKRGDIMFLVPLFSPWLQLGGTGRLIIIRLSEKGWQLVVSGMGRAIPLVMGRERPPRGGSRTRWCRLCCV